MTTGRPHPAVGIAYHAAIDQWARDHLGSFDVLEITVDHCLDRGRTVRAAIYDLVGRVPLTAHGVGLSIGTDVPLDEKYLDQVAEIIERLNKEVVTALVDTGIKAKLAELGNAPLAMTPADFGKLIADETEKWAKVIRAANIKAQ